ncbi:MAG: purine-nucleoside phosphorylase [Candidatus Kapaibacteriota bacterium]|jgi:purine-nucleoside phosphorylase
MTHLSNAVYEQCIQEAHSHIAAMLGEQPTIAIVLGTGLGKVAQSIKPIKEIPYADIPHFPLSTVESHSGVLIYGTLAGKTVLAMKGRFHYYEGYDMKEITFPIRVFKSLGIDTLFVSNACGALNPEFKASDIMIIDDHINLIGDNPLIGPNLNSFGPRFPDMSRPYDAALTELVIQKAEALEIPVHKGVYVAVSGPNLETRAEYKFLRIIGGDVVGMSTVPEVIVARHMGMRVAGFSIITDEGYHEDLGVVSLEDVIKAAEKAEPALAMLIESVVEAL